MNPARSTRTLRPHIAIARWIEEHPVTTNVIAVSVLTLLTVLMSVGLGTAGTIGAFLVALPAYFRITHPAPAALAVAVLVLFVTHVLQSWPMATGMWVVPMVVHSVASRCPTRTRLGIVGLAMVMALFLTLSNHVWATPLFSPNPYPVGSSDWWGVILLLTPLMWLTIATAYLFGDLKRVKRERQEAQDQRAQALADRAEALAAWAHRLEVERDQEIRMAAQDERTRIAREMHDVVAHSLSVVITQADGARYAAAADPRAATETLETISTTARESLKEMRRLLGVLRTDEGQQTAPVPAVSDLPDLAEGVRRTGLSVELSLPHDDAALSALPPGASLALYRLVQESLTNVLKHSPAATTAWVTVRHGEGWAEAEVLNDGLLSAPERASIPSSGQGLRGLVERLGVYGGQLQAGPVTGEPDRWVVRGWVRTRQSTKEWSA